MKLTAKNVMFILMCALLVLTAMMIVITLGRVSDFLQPDGNPNVNVPQNNKPSSNSLPSGSITTSKPIITEPGHEHNFVKTDTFSPNCVSSGYTLYECACGKTDIRDFKDPYGHKYGEYSVIAATCDTDGWTQRTCSRCNNVEKTNIVPAAHSFDDWMDVESADGMPTNEQRTCYDCGITEIRSLDTANTWVLRLSELEAQGSFAHYRIVVDLADNKNDPAYDVYSELAEPLLFDCVNSELWIYFSTDGIYSPFAVSAGNTVVTFYADGNVTLAEPVTTPDPEPDTPDPENPDPGTENPDPGTENPDPGIGNGGTGEEGTGEEGTGGDETPSGDITP